MLEEKVKFYFFVLCVFVLSCLVFTEPTNLISTAIHYLGLFAFLFSTILVLFFLDKHHFQSDTEKLWKGVLKIVYLFIAFTFILINSDFNDSRFQSEKPVQSTVFSY